MMMPLLSGGDLRRHMGSQKNPSQFSVKVKITQQQTNKTHQKTHNINTSLSHLLTLLFCSFPSFFFSLSLPLLSLFFRLFDFSLLIYCWLWSIFMTETCFIGLSFSLFLSSSFLLFLFLFLFLFFLVFSLLFFFIGM